MRSALTLWTAVVGLCLVASVGAQAGPKPEMPLIYGWFSTDSTEFIDQQYVLQQHVYASNDVVFQMFPPFLPAHMGLDAVDVLGETTDADVQ